MRLPDDNKRKQILAAAAQMFATQAYHKVRLDDVASAAGVGKGTLYVYFESKEELYFTITYESFESLLAKLKEQLSADHSCAIHRLQTVVGGLVDFNFLHPEFFEVLRTVGPPKDNDKWDAQRNEFFNLIEQIIQSGVSSGELRDAHPSLTARFIPGLVRSAMLFAQKNLDASVLKQQICTLLSTGLIAPQK
ncbi:MAG TPA: TetR/AcrR family transcriptional regulator [Tepidisphaeraceae bacterium]|jgi:AcrR family transcriptional regulator|nr:TetR/AcrR family transcriptional regulator [Tepidisphaeraceae bacterium]